MSIIPEARAEQQKMFLEMLQEGIETEKPDEAMSWVTMAYECGVPLDKIHVLQSPDGVTRAVPLSIGVADDETIGCLMTMANARAHFGLPILGQDMFTDGSIPGSGEGIVIQVKDINNFLPKMVIIDS